jgi:hypothetical protein
MHLDGYGWGIAPSRSSAQEQLRSGNMGLLGDNSEGGWGEPERLSLRMNI